MNTSNTSRQAIYIANLEGIDSNEVPVYGKPNLFYAYVYDVTSKVVYSEYVGREKDYDLSISVPLGTNTSLINEDCVVWVNVVPNENNNNWDYSIVRLGVPTKTLPLYCSARQSKKKYLYICNDKLTLLRISVNYDSVAKVITSADNEYINIDENTLVWTAKPADLLSTENRIKLVDKVSEKNGIKWYFKDVYDFNY